MSEFNRWWDATEDHDWEDDRIQAEAAFLAAVEACAAQLEAAGCSLLTKCCVPSLLAPRPHDARCPLAQAAKLRELAR